MATRAAIEELVAKMTEERSKLLSLLEALSEEEAARRPEGKTGEAEWSAKEQMAHLAAMETAYRAWVERALAEDDPDVSGEAGERPAISMAEAQQRSVAEHVAELKRQRARTLALIESITQEQYERRASTRVFGSLTVMQWLRSYYRHDRMHAAQISGREPDYQPRYAAGVSEPDRRPAAG
jgi:hypothetical protein